MLVEAPRAKFWAPVTPQLSERRKELRHKIGGAAEISVGGLSPLRGAVENISLGGCFINSRLPLGVGTEVVVRLQLGGAQMALAGSVCRVQPLKGIAIHFHAAVE
jgi:c-di-GMP-binding flagellar brake protein YcgR